jgi:hypothetical protein
LFVKEHGGNPNLISSNENDGKKWRKEAKLEVERTHAILYSSEGSLS